MTESYNGITYEVCLFAVKQGFDAIGGVQNAVYLAGMEWHKQQYQQKQQYKKSA